MGNTCHKDPTPTHDEANITSATTTDASSPPSLTKGHENEVPPSRHEKDGSSNETTLTESQGAAVHRGEEIGDKIASIRKSHPGNRMSKHFSLEFYTILNETERGAFLQCCQSGIDNPDSSMGCCTSPCL